MEMADGQTDLEKSMLEISTILGSYQYKMVFEAMSIENIKKQEKNRGKVKKWSKIKRPGVVCCLE